MLNSIGDVALSNDSNGSEQADHTEKLAGAWYVISMKMKIYVSKIEANGDFPDLVVGKIYFRQVDRSGEWAKVDVGKIVPIKV